jgi:nitrogen-specific signal transduction histidine kinase/CheY-like chemotaxis protein
MCLSDVDPNFSAERWPQHWKEIKEKKTFMFETIHKAKDGSIFPVEVVVNYMEFRGKEYNCAFARDISKRKKVSEEKKAVEDRLRQAQKMEAIGTLAGGIAHDFNNILSVILGYADLAFEGAPVESTLRMNLDKILKAGFRAKDLVKQILTFSRQTGVNPVPLNPAKTLKEAIILLRSSIPTTIKIIDIIDPDSGIILADPTQIHQVLINLCTNAYHAMELTGGEIKIVLKSVYLSQEDVLPEQGVDAGEYICLTVQDTGPGILPTVQERIFDPYFTTKETGKGTGLGLSIVHGIVKDFNGFIRFNSERGKGTAFHVFFPSVKKKVLPEESITEPVQKGTESILFIDDDETVAEVGELILKEIGYTVTVKTNSIDALETFRNKPDLFDLVITDQIMPNMTGIELAKRMLQIEPGIPIILCTGYNNTISEIKANSLGIKGVALKPILKKDIAKLIRKVLNGD